MPEFIPIVTPFNAEEFRVGWPFPPGVCQGACFLRGESKGPHIHTRPSGRPELLKDGDWISEDFATGRFHRKWAEADFLNSFKLVDHSENPLLVAMRVAILEWDDAELHVAEAIRLGLDPQQRRKTLDDEENARHKFRILARTLKQSTPQP